MLYKDELIEVTWHHFNRQHYKELGYNEDKNGVKFLAKQIDIPHGSSIRLKIKCDYCGKDYTAASNNYWRCLGKDACNNCKHLKYKEEGKRSRDDILKSVNDFCLDKGYILITNIQEDFKACDDVQYECPKHGLITTTISNLSNKHGCRQCKYESHSNEYKHSSDFVKETIESINGNIWLNPDGYTGINDRNLRIKCGTCGKHEYTTSFGNYYYHDVIMCPHCSARQPSDGEKIIAEILDKYNIKYIPEMRFDDCRDKKPLPFDFYLLDYNLIIEFDGPQHFEEKDGWTSLEITQRHDQIKNKYCETHGIDLLRIPYWEGHNIEEIILKKLTGKRYDLVS